MRSLGLSLSLAAVEKELLRGLEKGSVGGEPRTYVPGVTAWLSWRLRERTGGD